MADQVLSQAAIDAMMSGDAEAEADSADEALVDGLVAEDGAESPAEVAAEAPAAEAATPDAATAEPATPEAAAAEPATAEAGADAPEGASEAASEEEEEEDPKARFKTFSVSGSQETSENGKPSGAVVAGAEPEETPAEPAAPVGPAEPDPAMLARLQALEEGMAQATAGAVQLNQSFQAMMGHVTAMTNALNQMLENLSATPGFGAGNSFVCPSCGDAGHLTIPLTCSTCGEATETGWWPDE